MEDLENSLVLAMQKEFFRAYYNSYHMICPNIFVGQCRNELDLACVRSSGFLEEIEIKVGRADFIKDFAKPLKLDYKVKGLTKHEGIQQGLLPSNRFSFYVPEELVEGLLATHAEYFSYLGLYAYSVNRLGRGSVKEIISPKLIHRRKISMADKYMLGRKMAYRYWGTI